MSCLIRLCTSSLQPTCPNLPQIPKEGIRSHTEQSNMNECSGLFVPSINIFQPVVSCFESPQQLGWELETFYSIWERFLNHFPAHTCVELHLQPVCCGEPASTAYPGPGLGGHHHWPGWPPPPSRAGRDLQGWLTV